MAKRIISSWSNLYSTLGYIYTLSRLDTNEIIYVGMTNDLRHRKGQHLSYTSKPNTKIGHYVKSLYENGIGVSFDLLEVCNDWGKQKIEQYWIWQFKAWGMPLQNVMITKSNNKFYKLRNDRKEKECAGARTQKRPGNLPPKRKLL